MNQIKEIKKSEQSAVIPTVNYYPSITGLICQPETITAQLDDGRAITIPTA
jgi:hypothetical protein